jgi:hypothetical protein
VTDDDPIGVTFTNEPFKIENAEVLVPDAFACGVRVVAADVRIKPLKINGTV